MESIQRRAARWVCGSRWNPQTHQWSKSSTSCQQELKWPSLQTRRKYFAIAQAHDILHKRVSLPFPFKFSNSCTRSHHLSLATSCIFNYCFSFFINIPFLWNSIPLEILQISKSAPFQMALRRFLFN